MEQTPIDCVLSEQRKNDLSRRQQEIEFNRSIVYRILEIIIFLAQHNLSFRGHQESESAQNRGNFLGLVTHQAKHDPVLKEHLEKSKKNCQYLSPDIQNEFISLLADAVIDKIIVRAKEAKYFTLLLDETSDISRQERVSFILRYVNGTGTIEEHFIGVTAVKQTDHETLVLAIKEVFEKYGLSLHNLCGQGYDGAANMSSPYSGVQAMIRKENNKAIYMHCHAHILNLVLVESCSKNTIACNFFGDVQSLYVFIEGSTKHHSIFVDMQKTELCSTKQPVTLKRLSDTRWACRVNSLIAVKSTLPAIVSTLEKIVDSDHDSCSMSEANGLLIVRLHLAWIKGFRSENHDLNCAGPCLHLP